MDLFGDILLSLRTKANGIGVFLLGKQWGFAMPMTPPIYAYALSAIDMPFWVITPNAEPLALFPGDSVLLMHGGAYSVASEPTTPCISLIDYWDELKLPIFGPHSKWTAPVTLELGTKPKVGRLLSSAFVIPDSTQNPLLSALPPVVLIKGSGSDLFPWMPSLLRFLAMQETSTEVGYITTATHLAELIFSSFIRAHVLSISTEKAATNPTWLRGVADQRIRKALVAIHQNPGAPWSAEKLGEQAGMSRFAFMRRFSFLVGKSPSDYLTSWRMHLAAEQVILGSKSIGTIAEDLGYKSERAFREAFKKRFGLPPLRYAQKQSPKNLAAFFNSHRT